MLDPDEMLALAIAAGGEDMLSIGKWKPVLLSLCQKGYMAEIKGGPSYADPETKWYRITPAGREAYEAAEDGELRAMIQEHNARVRSAGPVIEGEAEDITDAPV